MERAYAGQALGNAVDCARTTYDTALETETGARSPLLCPATGMQI